MQFYWDGLVAGLVEALAPGQTMHFGAYQAGIAAPLARLLKSRQALLHLVARGAELDLAALRAECGDALVVHNTTPANAIDLMAVPELAIIDGDPNYHTVHTILTALHAKAASTGRPLPVILVAATGFPYARRDGYDDPAAIPEAARFPHERAGILPHQTALGGSLGLHANRYNATVVHEPRAGVLTAIEDFSHGCALSVWHWPYAGGVSLLVARDAAQSGKLAQLAYDLALSPGAFAMAEAADMARVQAELAVLGARHAASQAQAHAQALTSALAAERQAIAGLRFTAANPPSAGKPASPPPGFFSPPTMTDLLKRKKQGAEAPAARGVDAADRAELEASAMFDAAWYLAAYPDVAASGMGAAEHYLALGAAEGRNPGPHFNSAYYLARNADVAAANLNPLLHYLRGGAFEGRDPSPDFCSKAYLEANGDVSEARLNPLEHYLRNGQKEGRVAHPVAA